MLDTLSDPPLYAIADPVGDELILLALRDVSDLYTLHDETRAAFLRIGLLAAAVAAALGYLLAAWTVRPLHGLTRTARRLGETDAPSIALPTARRDEVGELARAFDDMRLRVATREEELRAEAQNRQALLEALAHELRTPLCALLGNVRLLQSPALSGERRGELADGMAREIKRLSAMDEQLMRLVGLSHEPPERTPVNVLLLLGQTVERLSDLAAGSGVTLRVCGEDAILDSDASLLALIADNLTVNAIRASHAGQLITLTAHADGFSVRDEGIGMTDEQLSRALEPFYKADKARTRRAGGAGLGLSLCAKAADALGGALTLHSAPGAGTTACFITSLHPVADFVTRAALSSCQEVKHS